MGLCLPCLNGTADDLEQPDPEEKRRQQAAAAEKRMKSEESRGIKDPEAFKRRKLEKEKIEKQSEQQGGGEGGLKWHVG